MRGKRFAWMGGALLLALAGCVQLGSLPNPWAEPTPEELLEQDLAIGTVGHVTEIANGGAVQVSGVGIVFGLDGTGGSPAGEYRTMLEQQLRKQKIENTRAILDSPNNAMVLVTAFLPAGVRKGEMADVEIVLPEGSRATSLKGGYLADCPLRNHELASRINPEKGDRTLLGHVLATAKGPLLVGLGNPDDAKEKRRARIWSGATSHVERPFYLMLTTKDDKKSARVTNAITQRINRQFQDDPKKAQIAHNNRDLMLLEGVTQSLNGTFDAGYGKGDMAKALNEKALAVRVPYAYRYNHERFLRVARLLPMADSADEMRRYRKRLESMLLDPKHAVRAALRLEALGKDSVPVLKQALSSEHALVRFAAAESLTYLDSTSGVEELAKLAVSSPELRAYGLIAMAGLDEAVCRAQLGELMKVDDPELRGGAFRALRLLDENDSRLHDEPIARQFFLHKVAPDSPSLVLFATHKRAEVVLFGAEPMLLPPVSVTAGSDFTITAVKSDQRVTVSRVTAKGVKRTQCTLLLEDVVRSLGELGASYAEVVDLLKNLDEQRSLSCRIREMSPPVAAGIETLVAGDLKDTKLPSSSE